MGHTVNHCIDYATDEAKNTSLLSFYEGLKSFSYRDYFNESFFLDHNALKEKEYIEITPEES